jgi:hypothetical protein
MPEKHNTVQWFTLIGGHIGKKIKDLEDRVAYLERLMNVESSSRSISTQSQNSEVSGIKKENCLYFAGVATGTFSKPSSELEENSLYRFEKIDESKACVYVIENNQNVARKFANNMDSHETACEYSNQCPENPSGIKTIEPGEAVLTDNNKWKITTKVKVEYLG